MLEGLKCCVLLEGLKRCVLGTHRVFLYNYINRKLKRLEERGHVTVKMDLRKICHKDMRRITLAEAYNRYY